MWASYWHAINCSSGGFYWLLVFHVLLCCVDCFCGCQCARQQVQEIYLFANYCSKLQDAQEYLGHLMTNHLKIARYICFQHKLTWRALEGANLLYVADSWVRRTGMLSNTVYFSPVASDQPYLLFSFESVKGKVKICGLLGDLLWYRVTTEVRRPTYIGLPVVLSDHSSCEICGLDMTLLQWMVWQLARR